MKNRILPFLLSLIISGTAMSQTAGRIGSHESIQWTPSSTHSFNSVSEVKEIAQQIIELVGLKANFELREANIPNAAAVSYAGRRYILYNSNFIKKLDRSTGTKWAGISVLAHEIGHHLNGHTISASGSQPKLELEADEFSGFVLRKMGASLGESQAAMKVLASINASRTHPGKYDRLTSIETGWNKADAQTRGKDVAQSKPVARNQSVANNYPTYPTQKTTSQTAIADRYIIGKVVFHADPYAEYYVTTRYNVVKVKGSQMMIIGKLANTKSRQYPYLIYDEASTQLFVDYNGNILTKQGRQVGKLTAKG